MSYLVGYICWVPQCFTCIQFFVELYRIFKVGVFVQAFAIFTYVGPPIIELSQYVEKVFAVAF